MDPPVLGFPTEEDFWSAPNIGKPNLDFLRNHFRGEGRLSEVQALWIIESARKILVAEPTLLTLNMDQDQPINIRGDICGQYFDLLKLLEIGSVTSQYELPVSG